MKKIFSLLGLCCLMLVAAQSGKVRVKTAAIGFYNVENLFDTIPSADYIDGTLSPKNPAFHRSVPLDSVKFLEVTEEYKGPWSNDKLIGKKVIRYQGSADEFTPKSGKNYTTKIYKKKLENAAKVISELGVQYTNTAPVVVGLLEIENRQVLEDLVKEPALAKYNYGIAHYNSFDYRGVDVALIYQKGRFVPTSTEKKELVIFNKEG
ncbi:MAG: endonuclease, partial [Cruoricaptor ignavus]|nr:endonuclease [Cruoricaptor ignavus]